MEQLDELYIMSDYYGETFYVSEDRVELEDKISKDFYSDPCDHPSDHAENYKVWAYTLKENKTRYEYLYRRFKPTYLSKAHIRGKTGASGEVLASFTISEH